MSDVVHQILFSGSIEVKGIQVIRKMNVTTNIYKTFDINLPKQKNLKEGLVRSSQCIIVCLQSQYTML